MDYFNNVLTTFLGLKCGSCVAVYAGSERVGFYEKYLNLCSEDERRSYGFGTTWGWVINDKIIIFGRTITLNIINIHFFYTYCSHFYCYLYWRQNNNLTAVRITSCTRQNKKYWVSIFIFQSFLSDSRDNLCVVYKKGKHTPFKSLGWGQCFLFDIRDCMEEWLLCFYCASLSPSLLTGLWNVAYVSVVLFCYILDAVLCYVWKKKMLITKKKKSLGWVRCTK